MYVWIFELCHLRLYEISFSWYIFYMHLYYLKYIINCIIRFTQKKCTGVHFWTNTVSDTYDILSTSSLFWLIAYSKIKTKNIRTIYIYFKTIDTVFTTSRTDYIFTNWIFKYLSRIYMYKIKNDWFKLVWCKSESPFYSVNTNIFHLLLFSLYAFFIWDMIKYKHWKVCLLIKKRNLFDDHNSYEGYLL